MTIEINGMNAEAMTVGDLIEQLKWHDRDSIIMVDFKHLDRVETKMVLFGEELRRAVNIRPFTRPEGVPA